MPNRHLHTIYKEWVEMLKNEEASKSEASQQAMEEIEEQMSGMM